MPATCNANYSFLTYFQGSDLGSLGQLYEHISCPAPIVRGTEPLPALPRRQQVSGRVQLILAYTRGENKAS